MNDKHARRVFREPQALARADYGGATGGWLADAAPVGEHVSPTATPAASDAATVPARSIPATVGSARAIGASPGPWWPAPAAQDRSK